MNDIEKLLSDLELGDKMSSFPMLARPGITGVGGRRWRGGHISKAAPAGGAAVLGRGRHGGGRGGEAGGAGPAGVGLLPAVEHLASCWGERQAGLSPLRDHRAGLGLLGGILGAGLTLLQVCIANLPGLFAALGCLQTGRPGAGLQRRFGGFL